MDEIEFDKALSGFLGGEECERVSEAVFQPVRAGWKAAMGSDTWIYKRSPLSVKVLSVKEGE